MSPLALAALGLLRERPRHPYDVGHTMRRRCMHEHIRLNPGTLYHAFAQLERAGWIRALETERDGRRPERTVYELTAAGRAGFEVRVRELVAVPEGAYSGFEAGLAFLHDLAPAEAAAALRGRAAALEAMAAGFDEVVAELRGRGLGRIHLIEVELAQETRRLHARWSREIAAQIERGDLPFVRVEEIEPQGKDGRIARPVAEGVKAR